jgi:hypothetical protein
VPLSLVDITSRGFITARARADLENDVLLVVGIFGNEEDLQLLEECVAFHFERSQLFPCELPHLRVAAVDQLLGAFGVLLDGLVFAELLDQRLELRQSLGGAAVLGGVGLHLGRTELHHQLVVLVFDAEKLVEHNFRSNDSSSGNGRHEGNLVSIMHRRGHPRILRVDRDRHRPLVFAQRGPLGRHCVPYRARIGWFRHLADQLGCAGKVAQSRK